MPFTDLEWIRFEITDTTAPFVFGDVEILNLLIEPTIAGNKYLCAAELLLIWARSIGKEPKFTIGRFSEDPAAAAAFLEAKAEELLQMHAASVGGNIGAYVGGISVADKAAKAADSDRTSPSFKRGMMSNPEAGW